MKISVTTDQGEVVDILTDAMIGDLSKPLARADLLHTIILAIEAARKLDQPGHMSSDGCWIDGPEGQACGCQSCRSNNGSTEKGI